MKKIREDHIEKQSAELKGLKDINEFLSLINSTINDIRKSEQKKYSLLSSIFNCFYENKTTSLPRKTIYEYILLDILNYKNKMLISFVKGSTNSMDIISEENYIKKTDYIIRNNRCLIKNIGNQNVDKILLDINFIITHKNLLLKNIFGNFSKITIIEPKKNKKNNTNKDKIFYNTNSKIININNINNINGSSTKKEEIQYLTKKRKSHRNHILKELRYKNKNNSINSSEEKYDDSYTIELLDKEKEDDKQKKIEEQETFEEEEMLSEINEFFNGNGLLKEIESKKNNSNNPEDMIFFKNLLLNYQNGGILKLYLNIINNDNEEFQNSFKSLIDYKNSLNDNSNSGNFKAKFSIMNKIISTKKKCIILIDKIVAKLKQLILEYKFIKKVLKNIDESKSDIKRDKRN